MPLVKKDVLWAGSWQYPDEVLTLTPRDLKRAVANANDMLNARLGVKWSWEHQAGVIPKPAAVWANELADPAKRKAFASGVITDAVKFEMGNKDGKPAVFACYDSDKITPEEQRQIERAGKVSCRLDKDFRDPATGRVYPGWSISHIAVTPKPVHNDQGPFLMSQASRVSAKTFFMGDGKPDDEKPDDRDGDGVADDADTDDEPAEETPETGEELTQFQKMRDKLVSLGLKGAGAAQNLKDLNTALDALIAHGVTMSDGDDDSQDPLDPDATTSPAGNSMPMMMSMAEMRKEYPTRVTLDQEEIRAEIRGLVRKGKIPAFLGDKWLKDFGTFEMSYVTETGKPARVGVLAAIDAAKENFPDGLFLSKKGAAGKPDAKEMSGINGGKTKPADKPAHLSKKPDGDLDDLQKTIVNIAAKNNPANAKN